jgi:hypothetical protein
VRRGLRGAGAAARIEVRIGRLVLDGLPVDRRHGEAVRHAVEAELARLLGEAEPALGGGTMGRLRGPDIQLPQAPGAEALGGQVARAVHGAIAPAPTARRASG